MENRKYVKILIPFFIAGFFIFQINNVFAYGVETHAYLTSEAIELYSRNFPNNQISYELKSYLIDGSRREDDIPRWMNHFYDPIYDRGLTYDPKIDPLINLGNWQKSKDWAQDGNNQNSLTYKIPVTIASVLTAIQQKKISALTTETDFTWDKAIQFYIQGEKEKAMFILGHILHLIEDTSVPDHTRNDPHPDSPYEEWTKQFTLNNSDNNLSRALQNEQPIVLADLNSYFDGLANYSNNNFYSKDTIGIQSGYNLPEIENIPKRINGRYFAINNNSQPLFFYKKYDGSLIIDFQKDISLADPSDLIMSSYWSLLSAKSVQYSAGAINLFFQEVEAARNNPEFLKTEDKSFLSKTIDATKGFFAQVGSAMGGFFSGFGGDKNFQLVSEISLDNNSENVQENTQQEMVINNELQNDSVLSSRKAPQNGEVQAQTNLQIELENKKSDDEVYKEDDNIDIEESKNIKENSVENIQSTESSMRQCGFNASQLPLRQGIIINEVAWMGTTQSANDEWIELKNISSNNIDLTNWQLIDKDEQIKINLAFLEESKIIAPGRFILLERTSDDSVPNIAADLIYVGALSNSSEGLRLFNSQCNLIDEVITNSDWPAGDSSARKTMERDSAGFNWHTSSIINGTPRTDNSESVVYYGGGGGGGGGGGAPTDNQQQETGSPEKILINEIQITGGAGKTDNDFIELYNPNNFQVNLNGYRLIKRTKTGTNDTSIKSWTTDAFIPANGYYLWANSDYVDISVIPDSATTAAISNDNGVALRFGSADTGEIIDSIGWGEAQNIFIEGLIFPNNPDTNQSIQRKFQNNIFIDTDNNANDFEIQTCPSPGTQSGNCPSANQAPSAFFVYAPSSPQIGDLIDFNAASSTDSDGQIVSYQWDFGDNATSSISTATTTHSYSQAGDYLISLVVFDDQNASSTEASSTIYLYSSTIQNFSVTYSSSSMNLNFNWQTPHGQDVPTSTLTYKITDISNSSYILSFIESTSTDAGIVISEIGRNYDFSIQAFGENNWSSGVSTTTINIPSFLNSLSFYQNTQASSTDYLIETYYDEQHFVPDLFRNPRNNDWKLIIFYLNNDADKQIDIYETWQPDDLINVLPVQYNSCAGALIQKNSLMIPDLVGRCGVGGGAYNQSLNFPELEDNHFIIYAPGLLNDARFASSTPETNYITAAFYSTYATMPLDGTVPYFRLVAIDKTKYYFGIEPTHEAPQLADSLNLVFDKPNSRLSINWSKATDADTLDSLLTYEIKYSGSMDWIFIGSATGTVKMVNPGDSFSISVRAKDDFGNYSSSTTPVDWTYPETIFYISQTEANNFSNSFGYYINDMRVEPVVFQGFTPEADFSFNKAILKMKQQTVNDRTDLRLSIYPDDGNNKPDFTNQLGTATLRNLLGLDGSEESTFNFFSSVPINASSTYWLVLDVAGYGGADGYNEWTRNQWQVATSNSNPYGRGISGGAMKQGENYHSFYYSNSSDWYMKLGLE